MVQPAVFPSTQLVRKTTFPRSVSRHMPHALSVLICIGHVMYTLEEAHMEPENHWVLEENRLPVWSMPSGSMWVSSHCLAHEARILQLLGRVRWILSTCSRPFFESSDVFCLSHVGRIAWSIMDQDVQEFKLDELPSDGLFGHLSKGRHCKVPWH